MLVNARVALQPDERKSVTFHLPVNQLAFYDTYLNLVLEPGRVLVMLGSSSEDICLNGEFELCGAAKMPVARRVFVTPVIV
jgi:beta-glucosidase